MTFFRKNLATNLKLSNSFINDATGTGRHGDYDNHCARRCNRLFIL